MAEVCKLSKFPNFVVGSAGPTMTDTLLNTLRGCKEPFMKMNTIQDAFAFYKALFELWSELELDTSKEVEILVATKSKIFLITEGSVDEIEESICIGSGQELALGALNALIRTSDDYDLGMSTKEIVELAIDATSESSLYCGKGMDVYELS